MLTENQRRKLGREETLSYLDVDPTKPYDWALIGIGINSMGQNYNPQKLTEKWIIYKNSTTTTESYQISVPASQKCYKGDPVFEFINKIRRKAGVGSECVTHILDVDSWDSVTEEGVTKCNATLYECNISITKYNDENAVIEYDIDYNGDPVLGTIVFNNEKPVFTKDEVTAE